MTAGSFALVAQAVVTLVGGGYALWKFAVAHGKDVERMERVLKQVEPNKGSSMRDDLTELKEQFGRFTAATEGRLKLLENKP